ncbi:response regulator [Pedobacter sp. LMG 31464]|uniref:histidine kinase n=1 Tax=Pedobacter planticolens TaxID=2679964 RepID=A0A923DXI5_9SPHI|nr:ATP-binding protein [Pedobacter planticolens]MBB2145879.1 response regulator [Pedobacter planticolens]
MTSGIQKRFIRATKGKVVIGFLFACFALLTAWGISKFVFTEMLYTVEKLSTPNNRLRIVSELSNKIARLDQLQRDQAFNNAANEGNFIKETRYLRLKLDTLSILYKKDAHQLKRIKSIKRLLSDRDKQFLLYLEVRETLINTKSFSEEVKKLNELVSERSRQVDSAVITTATSTTTVVPEEEEKSKGFLSRLFGKKKAEVYKIINEEFKIKHDTLNALAEDSIMKSIGGSLQDIELEQRQKSEKFLKRESVLANSSNALTKQMLDILREVEAEALAQIDLNGTQAKEVVNDGVIQITAIIIVFFLITVVLVYLILLDITKSNKYRKALELAKDEAEYHGKAKQRFLSNMSHEIRTPLQSILGYSEAIVHQANPNKKDIDAIYQSAVHLLQIVNEILDYNRIISGEFSFNKQAFNINNLLAEVVAVMQPLAEQKSIKLISTLDIDDNIYVVGDPFRLKQILFNLLGNAIKFTLKGGVFLRISCKQQENDLHFSFIIEDTGIGFGNEHIERIFNEFEQIDTPEKYLINRTGTGLGLAIVKSLIESQEGRIHVKSKVGVGTTFSVYLKYILANEQQSETINSNQFAFLNTGKVWVIDDDKLILDLCGLIFDQHHIPYQSYSEVASVLNEQTDENVKYVLIDMRLPEMSGIKLCHLLKKRMSPEVKFYAITAQVLPDEREMVLKEGFEGIIMKPFRSEDLLSIFDKSEIAIEPVDFNISSLEKMTLGDQQMLEKILQRFKEDSASDADELKVNLSANDQANSRLIIHRLAGRIAQIGSKKLGASFRLLEEEIAKEETINSHQKKAIFDLLLKLEELITLIDKKDYSMP